MSFARPLVSAPRIGARLAARRHLSGAAQPKVALVLSGCGVYDGSEITEAIAALVHLSKHNANVEMFAPNKPQMHVVNHVTGEPSDEQRNCMVEAARIARGKIKPLSDLAADSSSFGAVVFPGGFGAAKNLSTFAVDGPNMQVDNDVRSVVNAFHQAKKPIGMACISPVIAAKVLPGASLTLGKSAESPEWPYSGACGAASTMGAKHEECDIHEACVDTANKLVTAPAYMKDAAPHEVFESVGAMINGLMHLLKGK